MGTWMIVQGGKCTRGSMQNQTGEGGHIFAKSSEQKGDRSGALILHPMVRVLVSRFPLEVGLHRILSLSRSVAPHDFGLHGHMVSYVCMWKKYKHPALGTKDIDDRRS
jgi:hypothetical protein